MDISTGMQRISGLGDGLTYVTPVRSEQPIEPIRPIKNDSSQGFRFSGEDPREKAQSFLTPSGKTTENYTKGSLFDLRA